MTMNVSSTTFQYGDRITVSRDCEYWAEESRAHRTNQFHSQFPNSVRCDNHAIYRRQRKSDSSGHVHRYPQQSEWYNATYSGDTNYATSNAPGVFVNVNIPEFSLNVPPVRSQLQPGSQGRYKSAWYPPRTIPVL